MKVYKLYRFRRDYAYYLKKNQFYTKRFTDDIDMMEERRDVLQAKINILHMAGEAAGLRINIGKTKTLVFGIETLEEQMKVGNEDLENVTEFEYLGSLLSWDSDCGKETKKRIAKALGAMAGLECMEQ